MMMTAMDFCRRKSMRRRIDASLWRLVWLALYFYALRKAYFTSSPSHVSQAAQCLSSDGREVFADSDAPAGRVQGLLRQRERFFAGQQRGRAGPHASPLASVSRFARNITYPAHVVKERLEDPRCASKVRRQGGIGVENRINIVVPTILRDISHFRRLQLTLLQFANQEQMPLTVIVPDAELIDFLSLVHYPNTLILTESEVLPDLASIDFTPYTSATDALANGKSWYTQQLLKFAVHALVDTEYYLVVDSDVLAVNDLDYDSLIIDGRAVANIAPGPRRFGHTARWSHWAADALQTRPAEPVFGVTPAILSRTIVASLLTYLEHDHRRTQPDDSKRKRWPSILVNEIELWTEYAFYYAFAEGSGLFGEYHVACEGRLYYYAAWGRFDWKDLDLDLLFRQSLSLFTVVQSHARRQIAEDDFNQMLTFALKRASSRGRLGRLESLAAMKAAIRELEMTVPQRELLDLYAVGHRHSFRPTQAYVTSAPSNELAFSALTLGASLRNTHTQRKLICLVPRDELSPEALTALALIYDEIVHLPSMVLVSKLANVGTDEQLAEQLSAHLHPSTEARMDYQKLHIFNMTAYSRMVYLGPRTLVMRNLDYLFRSPSPAAVPEMMPPDTFNSELMVVEPSPYVFDDLQALAERPGDAASDQQILNAYFDTWFSLPDAHRLPVHTSLPTGMRGYTSTAFCRCARNASTLQFQQSRPWADIECQERKMTDLHRLWWTAFGLLWTNTTTEEHSHLLSFMETIGIPAYTERHRSQTHRYIPKLLDNSSPLSL